MEPTSRSRAAGALGAGTPTPATGAAAENWAVADMFARVATGAQRLESVREAVRAARRHYRT